MRRSLLEEHGSTEEAARSIRRTVLDMVHHAGTSHVGTCFSMVDVLAVLYGRILRYDPDRPDDPRRDRVVLSKGHGAAAMYATLAEAGFFPKKELEAYCEDGSDLAGHITHHGVPGVEASSGSLGHGLSMAAGMALADKRDGLDRRTIAILSDGEMDEGSTWEPILFGPHHDLDNLVAIVDYNKIQSFGRVEDVLDLDPLAEKWASFNWAVTEVDGHNHDELEEVLGDLPLEEGKPTALVAHTVKGKGVSFMEDDLGWHYFSPDDEQYERARSELDGEP